MGPHATRNCAALEFDECPILLPDLINNYRSADGSTTRSFADRLIYVKMVSAGGCRILNETKKMAQLAAFFFAAFERLFVPMVEWWSMRSRCENESCLSRELRKMNPAELIIVCFDHGC